MGREESRDALTVLGSPRRCELIHGVTRIATCAGSEVVELLQQIVIALCGEPRELVSPCQTRSVTRIATTLCDNLAASFRKFRIPSEGSVFVDALRGEVT